MEKQENTVDWSSTLKLEPECVVRCMEAGPDVRLRKGDVVLVREEDDDDEHCIAGLFEGFQGGQLFFHIVSKDGCWMGFTLPQNSICCMRTEYRLHQGLLLLLASLNVNLRFALVEPFANDKGFLSDLARHAVNPKLKDKASVEFSVRTLERLVEEVARCPRKAEPRAWLAETAHP